MSLDLDALHRRFRGDSGPAKSIRRWYRRTYRELRGLGFRALGRGNFVAGPFKVYVRFTAGANDCITGSIKIIGPSTIKRRANLYRLPHIKFVTLNKAGDICKIPGKSWDRKRKNRSITEL